MTGDESPARPDEGARPKIGTDEWVAQSEERTRRRSGPFGALRRRVDLVPAPARLAGFVVVAAVVPFVTSSDYVVRVGAQTLIFALLTVGLNVVVGFSGLLDLGYVAFFGFGAYGYALLSSEHYGVHWPAHFSVPVIAVASAALGLLLGLPSRRLLGDYLAILTLFFLQAFVVFTTNGSAVSFFGLTPATNLTGGPNGISGLDPFRFLGLEIAPAEIEGFFWLALGAFVVVVTALHFLSESRTGRAWRALREDPLAAEQMGIPVNRLKLLAFAMGAAIAGIAGTIQAPLNTGVFPSDYDLPLLVTVYAMLILGGVGSLTGALLGALALNVSLELLRDANQARWIFYALILLALVARMRPWAKLAIVAGGTLAFGLVLRTLLDALWPSATGGALAGGDLVGRAVQSWVVQPESSTRLIGNIGVVILIGAVLGLTLLQGRWRTVALVPTLYLAVFVWENRLVTEPSVTRFLVLGGLLVVLMTARPQGLLGTARVEIA